MLLCIRSTSSTTFICILKTLNEGVFFCLSTVPSVLLPPVQLRPFVSLLHLKPVVFNMRSGWRAGVSVRTDSSETDGGALSCETLLTNELVDEVDESL